MAKVKNEILQRQINTKNFILLAIALVLVITLALFITKTQGHFTNSFSNLRNKVTTPYNQNQLVKPTKTKVKISEKDSGKQINIDVGQQFVITLETGLKLNYQWQLAQSFDSNIVELTDIKFRGVKQNVTLSMPTSEWSFKGTGRGRVKLQLSYTIPWDKNTSIDKTETFYINIR